MVRHARFAAWVRPGLLFGLACTALVSPASSAAPSDISYEAGGQTIESRWTADALGKLVKAIESAKAEGLDPADYNLAALRQAMAGDTGPSVDALAQASALTLAHDFYFGRVTDRGAMGWMIQRPDYEAAQLPARLDRALADGKLGKFYAGLLPIDPRYVALRAALNDAPDTVTRNRLRANMERWRWMPRNLGKDYLYVNVPSYRLRVIDGDATLASYDVVVGAKDMPTPQLASPTSSLVVNPWWYVPASIVRKSGLHPGKGDYKFQRTASGWSVRQPPGPKNALGRIKFNLINDQAIYLHDTPAKRAFTREDRALSHGCIRVKDIDQLATQLMEQGGDAGQLDDALASDKTATLALPQTWQVYIVYFTVDRDEDGSLANYGDPYGYDAKIVAALDGPALQVASR